MTLTTKLPLLLLLLPSLLAYFYHQFEMISTQTFNISITIIACISIPLILFYGGGGGKSSKEDKEERKRRESAWKRSEKKGKNG